MKLQIARLVAKLLGHRNFNIANGKIYLWGAPMFFFSLETLPHLYHGFKDKRKISEVLYFLGKLQGYNGTNILIKRFGLKKKDYKPFMDLFVDQTVMLGIGKARYRVVDDSLPHFVYQADAFTFPYEYKRLFGKQNECICAYMRGMASGGTEALMSPDQELVAIENKCIAKGDPYCEFAVKPKEQWKKDALFKSQYFKEPQYYKKFKVVETATSVLSGNK